MKTRRPTPGTSPLGSLIVLLLTWTSAVCASPQPFLPVETAATSFAKRQTSCLADFFSCADQGAVFNGVCCQTGQRCAVDANNQPACCPAGAVCTGTVPASFATPNPTTAVSYVPNAYFSFPYIATSFANPAHCSAAVSQCSANYAACTAQLAGGQGGGGYAVTIVVPGGGGTTVAGGGMTLGGASATSICNSLSDLACKNLETSMCTLSATSREGFYFGTGNAGARPTAAPVYVGLVGAVAVGVAGMGVV